MKVRSFSQNIYRKLVIKRGLWERVTFITNIRQQEKKQHEPDFPSSTCMMVFYDAIHIPPMQTGAKKMIQRNISIIVIWLKMYLNWIITPPKKRIHSDQPLSVSLELGFVIAFIIAVHDRGSSVGRE